MLIVFKGVKKRKKYLLNSIINGTINLSPLHPHLLYEPVLYINCSWLYSSYSFANYEK